MEGGHMSSWGSGDANARRDGRVARRTMAAAWALFALTACAPYSMVRDVGRIDGLPAREIECGGSRSVCHDAAGRACPLGYSVVREMDNGGENKPDLESAIVGALLSAAVESALGAKSSSSSKSTSPSTPSPPAFRGTMTVKCQETGAPAVASTPATTTALKEPPNGVVGFRFDEDRAHAKKVCVESDHEWQDAPSGGQCSGTPTPMGIDALATVRFCKDRVCEVVVRLVPDDDDEMSSWTGLFARVRSGLGKRYGEQTSYKRNLPEECRTSMSKCLTDGRAFEQAEWRWPDGHAVVLASKGTKASKDTKAALAAPAVTLTYTRPDGTTATTAVEGL